MLKGMTAMIHLVYSRLYFKVLLLSLILPIGLYASDGNIFSECSNMEYCKNDYLSSYMSLGLDGSVSIYNKRFEKNNCCVISFDSYLVYEPFDTKTREKKKVKFELIGSVLGIDKFYLNEDGKTLFMLREIAGANTNCVKFFLLKLNNFYDVSNGRLCSQGYIPAISVDRDNDKIKVKLKTFDTIWTSKYYYYNNKKDSMELLQELNSKK